MGTKPAIGRSSGWSVRAVRLNFREILPVRSLRHPGHLSTPPSDAFAVLWLETTGVTPDPRFAYLNHARAMALYQELGRALSGRHDSAAERAQRALNITEGVATGEASGA